MIKRFSQQDADKYLRAPGALVSDSDESYKLYLSRKATMMITAMVGMIIIIIINNN